MGRRVWVGVGYGRGGVAVGWVGWGRVGGLGVSKGRVGIGVG